MERLKAGGDRPRVVLVNALHSKSGGGNTYLRMVIPRLARSAELRIHLCIHQSQLAQFPDGFGDAELHVLSFPPSLLNLLAWEQLRLPGLARRIGADVVYSLANYGPIFARHAVVLLRNSLDVIRVDWRLRRMAYWSLMWLATAASLVASRHAIAVSDYMRATICGGWLKRWRSRVTVVHHGVSDVFSPPDDPRAREDFLLAVSDIYVQKNFHTLVQALTKPGLQRPGIQLRIAGRAVDDRYFRRLRNVIETAGVQDRVVFLGHVPQHELAALYRRCAVFVFPSSAESFGMPLVEAMASGAPIASSRSAAMPEILGDAAEYFDASDVDDIARTVGRVIDDAELRRDLCARAVARSKDFSWDRTAERTAAVLTRVADQAQRPRR